MIQEIINFVISAVILRKIQSKIRHISWYRLQGDYKWYERLHKCIGKKV